MLVDGLFDVTVIVVNRFEVQSNFGILLNYLDYAYNWEKILYSATCAYKITSCVYNLI